MLNIDEIEEKIENTDGSIKTGWEIVRDYYKDEPDI